MIRITGLSILIIWSFLLTETPAKQDTKKEAKTVKYFDTNLKRKDILGNEISSKDARQKNHFKVTYDAQGKVVSIEFIPPQKQRGKKMEKRELFPKPRSPFRYFEKWDPHSRTLDEEVPEYKVGSRPFYRATFTDDEHVRTVEHFRKRNNLLWTYHIEWDKEMKDSKLSVLFNSHLPLTALDPHLYHPSLSEMKPGWIAQFRHNRLGRPLNTTVKDDIGNIYYFYDFIYRFETVGDSLNPINFKITTSKYYRADSSFMGKHELTFAMDNSLLKKSFFDDRGNITETIEYDFDPELNEVTILIRDPKGKIIHRQVMAK